MIKRQRRFLPLILATALAWGGLFHPSAVAAQESPLKEVWQSPIGEGTTLHTYSKAFANKQTAVHVTKVDLTNPYVEVKPIYGKDGLLTERQSITQMANEAGAVAAINADFFDMTKRGAPFGVVIKDKEVISSMGHISYWYSLGITDDQTAEIVHLGFTGRVTASTGVSFPLRGINKEKYNPSEGYSHIDQLNLYTPAFGKTSLGKVENYSNVVEVVFENGFAKEVRVDQPGAPIPSNGFVLWGQGAAANFLLQNVPVGSRVDIEYQTTPTDKQWYQAVGGHVLLVDQGQALTTFQTDAATQAANAHTAVGISRDGKTLYLVVAEESANSKGVTLAEMARIMVELGAYRAVNFDGGGSSTMSARLLGEAQAKLINQPKGGSERRVPTGLAVFNTAPPGELQNFQLLGPTEVLIGQAVEFTTKAYDNHYLPYTIKPEELTWETEQRDAGLFEQNRFIPTRSGKVTVAATAGGITKTKTLHVYSGEEIAEVQVLPGSINLAPGQTTKLDVRIKTKTGTTIAATPLSVKVTTDSPLLSVDDQLQITAGDKAGTATITVSYDGKSTVVPVHIGANEQLWLTFDNLTGTYHSGHPESLNNSGSFLTVGGNGEPVYRSQKSARLNYNFTGARNDELRISYGRMGTQAVTMPGNPLGMALWVYGDNSRHWLRAEVLDGQGKLYLVDLADEIDWTGWKQVKGFFPANVSYPLQLKSIYVVNRPEGTQTRPETGTLYFDEISLFQPLQVSQQPEGKDFVPAEPGTLSLGEELQLGYSFKQTSSYLQKGRIDIVSNADLQLPGYVTADYSFDIKPLELVPGAVDQFSLTGGTITLTPKKWGKRKGVGLLYVNEVTNTFDQLIGQMEPNGNWVYQINAYGKYVPYYLDIPDSLPFMDIINHPAQAEIVAMTQKGYIQGMAEDVFGPEVALTRAQFVTLLSRVYKWELPQQPKLSFRDNVPEYARGAVQAAVAKGIIKGYEDNTFRPDQPMTRAEAAVVLDRLINHRAASPQPLADQQAWPNWARSAIANVVGQGLIDPVHDRFEADHAITRAVFVVALQRMLEQGQ